MNRSTFGTVLGPVVFIASSASHKAHAKAVDSPLGELDDWENAVVRDVVNLPLNTIHQLVCGNHINPHVQEWADFREEEVWRDFVAEMYAEDDKEKALRAILSISDYEGFSNKVATCQLIKYDSLRLNPNNLYSGNGIIFN